MATPEDYRETTTPAEAWELSNNLPLMEAANEAFYSQIDHKGREEPLTEAEYSAAKAARSASKLGRFEMQGRVIDGKGGEQ